MYETLQPLYMDNVIVTGYELTFTCSYRGTKFRGVTKVGNEAARISRYYRCSIGYTSVIIIVYFTFDGLIVIRNFAHQELRLDWQWQNFLLFAPSLHGSCDPVDDDL